MNTAIQLASSTTGAVDVDASHLTIEGSRHPLADSVITAKIKGIYIREKILDNPSISLTGIHVETSDGVVYLTGEAENRLQAENAEKIAKSIPGVKDVKSNISVNNK